MNRRAFIRGLGAFMILPGAGRIWKAERAWWPWPTSDRMSYCYDDAYLNFMNSLPPLDLDKMFDALYAIRQARERGEFQDVDL